MFFLIFLSFFSAGASHAVERTASPCPTEALLEDPGAARLLAFNSAPVQPTEPFRQIGILVTLEDGAQLLALGGSVSCQHDFLLSAIERKYGKKIKSIAWGGELELSPNPDRSLRIVQANETSSHLAKDLKIPSDSTQLLAAVKKIDTLKWDLPPGYSPKYDEAREHIHPSMKNRHDVNNKLSAPKMIFGALSERLQDGSPDFDKTRTTYAAIAKRSYTDTTEWVEGLRNDGIITNAAAVRFVEVFTRLVDNGRMVPDDFHFLQREFDRFEDELTRYQNDLADRMTVWAVPRPTPSTN